MSKGQYKKKKQARKVAKKKVPARFAQAAAHPEQKVADRLIRHARRMAMKFRMRTKPYKHLFCKHCYARFVPGKNVRVRIHGGKIIYYCFTCKKYRRIPIGKKVKG